MSHLSEIVMRPGAAGDAVEAGRIAYEAFRTIAEHHNFPPDFPSVDVATGLLAHLLSRGDVFSVVAEQEGRVVGSNFLWESDAIAGVGPITVDPSAQNHAIGRRLMSTVLARADDRRFASVRLVQAGYHGRSLALYTKLGFDAREPLSLLQGPPLGLRVPGRNVRAAIPADVDACGALAAQVLGHGRVNEVRDAVGHGLAMVVMRDGRIAGYTTGIGFFGHAVAEDDEDLQALIGAAPAIAGPGLLLPTRNAASMRWCLQRGLRVVQPMTLMSRGEYRRPSGAYLPSILY